MIKAFEKASDKFIANVIFYVNTTTGVIYSDSAKSVALTADEIAFITRCPDKVQLNIGTNTAASVVGVVSDGVYYFSMAASSGSYTATAKKALFAAA